MPYSQEKAVTMNTRSKLVAVLSLVAVLGLVLGTAAPAVAADQANIVEIAVGTPEFSILTEAVVAAGLAETLSGPGPYTVFAPSNAAFVQLLAELGMTKDQLFADKALLTRVLLYHVVPAEVKAAQVVGLSSATMVDGNRVAIKVSGGSVYINDAKVIRADIDASNGVIHAIDRVLLPPATITSDRTKEIGAPVVGIVINTPEFSILTEAVVAAGLVEALSGPGPYTIFAPSNAAFVQLLSELGMTKEQLFADKALLTSVLLYHVAAGDVFAQDAAGLSGATMLDGNRVTFSRDFFGLNVNNANVIRADINGTNGVIHAIDRVLLPPAK